MGFKKSHRSFPVFVCVYWRDLKPLAAKVVILNCDIFIQRLMSRIKLAA